MTSFVLKIIAVISMFCDHLGDAIFKKNNFLNLIGRTAFPIFAFQISQGYLHTKNVKKYFMKLFVFSFISEIPFYLFITKFLPSSSVVLNIFFTLWLGLLCMIIYDAFVNIKNKKLQYKIFNIEIKKIIGVLFVFIIASIGEYLKVDYGFWGIIVIFSFYLFKDNKLAMIISYICLCVIRYGINILYRFDIRYIYLCLCTILPIIFIASYKGKQGYKIKYFLYIFYPIHLLLLYLMGSGPIPLFG